MSLILEALRKSEAQRQLGRAPGLLTPVSMGESRRRYGPWPWLFGAALVLVGALAVAWWFTRGDRQDVVPAPSPASSAADGQPLPGTDPAAAATSESAPLPLPSESAPTPARPAPTLRPELPAAGPADMPSDPDFASTERESLPLPPPVLAPPSAPAPAASAPAESAPAPHVSTVQPPTPVEDGPPLIPLRTFSDVERAGLPPLHLSMHVYNDEPQRRFVLIDGRRLAEGAQIAGDVVLQEIRRDGAVLDIRGRRVLIERP